MKLNTKTPNPQRTHEGGVATPTSKENQLRRSVMTCMLWEDTFYEDGQSIADRIQTLAGECDSEFVADLALEAKTKGKLRHAPMWLGLGLLKQGSGRKTGDMLYNLINRADDIPEMLSMYWKNGRKPIAAQLKQALARSFSKFDAYQLAKYKNRGDLTLRDVMFLVHPKPKNEEQKKIFKDLADGTLKSADTWEKRLSAGEDKKQSFSTLLAEGKLGYLALLRNLRNMKEAGVDSELVRQAILKTPKNNKILPFQFLSAAKFAPEYIQELDTAMQSMLESREKLSGKTAILVDVSGSMDWGKISEKSILTPLDAASATAILLANICDRLEVFTFSNQVVQVPSYRGIALADTISSSQYHAGTRLYEAVDAINKKVDYDRLIVLTDEQAHYGPHERFKPLSGKKGYLINIQPYKKGVSYTKNWTRIDGFSEAVIDWIQEIESN